MNYSKYGDVSALLIELCSPFNEKELMAMTELGAKMANDKEFDRAYTLEVKSRYVENFQAIQNNSYIPKRFEELNKEICHKIDVSKNSHAVAAALLPDYAAFDKNNQNGAEKLGVLARIQKLKLKQQ